MGNFGFNKNIWLQTSWQGKQKKYKSDVAVLYIIKSGKLMAGMWSLKMKSDIVRDTTVKN